MSNLDRLADALGVDPDKVPAEKAQAVNNLSEEEIDKLKEKLNEFSKAGVRGENRNAYSPGISVVDVCTSIHEQLGRRKVSAACREE